MILGEGFSTVLETVESSLGAPDPSELATKQVEEEKVQQEDNTKTPEQHKPPSKKRALEIFRKKDMWNKDYHMSSQTSTLDIVFVSDVTSNVFVIYPVRLKENIRIIH